MCLQPLYQMKVSAALDQYVSNSTSMTLASGQSCNAYYVYIMVSTGMCSMSISSFFYSEVKSRVSFLLYIEGEKLRWV